MKKMVDAAFHRLALQGKQSAGVMQNDPEHHPANQYGLQNGLNQFAQPLHGDQLLYALGRVEAAEIKRQGLGGKGKAPDHRRGRNRRRHGEQENRPGHGQGFSTQRRHAVNHGPLAKRRLAAKGETVPEYPAGVTKDPVGQGPQAAGRGEQHQEGGQLPGLGNIAFLARLLDPPA